MRSVLAVSITIGTRLNFLISRQTSNPSRNGSITSRITASKPPERALASPCRPSIAVATRKPAAFSPIDTISRIDASSSTSSRRSSTVHQISTDAQPRARPALCGMLLRPRDRIVHDRSVHMLNRGRRAVAESVGLGEADICGPDAGGGVRAAYGRRGGGDRQPQAALDRPAVVQAQDDAGGEGVTRADGAADLLAR